MNDETVLVSPSKMCQNHTHTHTHTQGGSWYKTNEVNVRRQITNSQVPMYCVRVSTKWKMERPITLFLFFFFFSFCVFFLSLGFQYCDVEG